MDPTLTGILKRLHEDSPLSCDFEGIHNSAAVQNDPLKSVLFDFPEDEVELIRHDKHLRTVQGQTLEASSDMPLFVQDALAFYRDPWEVLQRKFEHAGEDEADESGAVPRMDASTLESLAYPENEAAPADPSARDALRPELLQADEKASSFTGVRPKVFDLYRGVPPLKPVKTPTVKPYEESVGRVIMFKPEELRFKLGDLEPFFCRASVYELSPDRCFRISEDFCFEANTSATEAMLKGNPAFAQRKEDDPVTSSRVCLFNIPVASQDVHLVLRIEKVYQGDLKAVSEAYTKVDVNKQKDTTKWKKLATAACSTVPYKAPFGYAILPLFNSHEEFVGAKNVKFIQVFRQALTSGEVGDDALFRVFNMDSKNTTKKMKTLPATFVCTMEDVTDTFSEIPNRVDPSLTPCLPEDPNNSSTLRELQSLPRQSVPIPHLHYVNNFYIRPEAFTVPKGVTGPIAIRIQLLEEDKEGQVGLPAVFGGFKEPRFVTEHVTPVAFNPGKQVMWYSELKIAVPLAVTRKHHLLFTIEEVDPSIQKGHKTVGFAFLPLLNQGAFIGSKHELAVHPMLKTGYLGDRDMRKLDGVLSVDTLLVSSVYTQLPQLRQVLRSIGDPFEPHTDPLKMVESMAIIMSADAADVIKFLPLILTHMFRLICTSAGGHALVLLASLMARLLAEADAQSVLMSYAEHTFQSAVMGGKHWIHIETVHNWFAVAKGSSDAKFIESYLRSARFLFQVIFKSMVYRTMQTEEKDRSARFDPDFVRDLEGLLVLCAWQIQQRCSGGPNLLAKAVNRHMALFIRDLFSVMDRGAVFRIIESVLVAISPEGADDLALVELKLDFLRVITEYKYWVALNLPLPGELTTVKNILPDFVKKHFLASTFLNEVTAYFGHAEQSVRLKTITTLAQLFERHEFDQDFADKPIAKRRIANIYFPFLLIVSDNIAAFKKSMDFGEKRLLFSCVVWELKNCDPGLLRQWWAREQPKRLKAFFDVLMETLKTFDFLPKEQLDEMLGTSKNVLQADSAKNALENFYSRRTEGGDKVPLREQRATQRRFATARRGGKGKADDSKGEDNEDPLTVISAYSYNETLEAHLNTEVSLVVLDIAEEFMSLFEVSFKQHMSKHAPVMERYLKLMIRFNKHSQSTAFLDVYYARLRSFVARFPVYLFQHRDAKSPVNACADLTFMLMKQLSSKSYSIRSHASGLLYLMMKWNYDTCDNFNRMRVEATVQLTKLLDTHGIQDDTNYRKGLSAILDYVSHDYPDTKNVFHVEMRELMDRFFRLLEYSVQLTREKGDPEMLADLYHSIALDYKNAPELRVAWLESLSHRHAENEAHAEAAHCWVHISALVAQYLYVKGMIEMKGAEALTPITPNAAEEIEFYDPTADVEGIYDSGTFTMEILVDILMRAIKNMKTAEFFEAAAEIYKLLVPIFEASHDYKKLADSHADLSIIYQSIMKSNTDESRLFGTYYRVTFFGKEFGHLDGEEFIYREKGLAKLRDISDRLTKIYGAKVGGADKISIMQQSGEVDRTTLGDGCHIQLTRVTPYFEPEENAARITYYERNTNIKQFFYEAPFLKNPPKPGKTIAEHVKDQWKRKTILSTEVAAPYIRRRLLVKKKEFVELSPIQNAISEISSRVVTIIGEVEKKPPNPKTLQPVLSGSVKILVNEGPKNMIEEFLKTNSKDYPQGDVECLARAFMDFLDACSLALELDKGICSPELMAFHNEMALGFEETVQAIAPYAGQHLPKEKPKSKGKRKMVKKLVKKTSLRNSSEEK